MKMDKSNRGFFIKSKECNIYLSDGEMQKTYMEGGWTIAQVVNHCADSHMNSFIQFKLALT